MTTARESVEKFDEKSSELINSKFLLAEKKIEELLVTIADSVLLYEIFEHVTEKFDYATFKSVCFYRLQDGRGCFRLPKNESDVIAFCFSLLLEIDGGKVDIIKLCSEFFPTEDGNQRSYNLFASQLLVPFKNAVLNVAYAVLDTSENQKPTTSEPISESPTKERKSNFSQDKANSTEFVRAVKNSVVETAYRQKGDYDELIFVLEELDDYLRSDNLRGVTLAFTALKYVAPNFKNVKIDLEKIAELISKVV